MGNCPFTYDTQCRKVQNVHKGNRKFMWHKLTSVKRCQINNEYEIVAFDQKQT